MIICFGLFFYYMKTIVILVVIILFLRIDYLLGLFDKAAEKLSSSSQPAEVNETMSNRVLIPVAQDRSLKKTPRETFLALLEDFRTFPTVEIRLRAMSIFKESPTMFNQKLDQELESHVYRWRELLNNNEPEVVNFILDLLNILQGENQEMMKRFSSIWMDINMGQFISAWSRTKDTNCSIATTFGENIPEEEKINEYYERQDALKGYLQRQNLDPAHKALATNCLLQLTILLEKLDPRPVTPPQSESDSESDSSATGFTP